MDHVGDHMGRGDNNTWVEDLDLRTWLIDEGLIKGNDLEGYLLTEFHDTNLKSLAANRVRLAETREAFDQGSGPHGPTGLLHEAAQEPASDQSPPNRFVQSQDPSRHGSSSPARSDTSHPSAPATGPGADNERLKRELQRLATQNEILRATASQPDPSARPPSPIHDPQASSRTDLQSAIREGQREPNELDEEFKERLRRTLTANNYTNEQIELILGAKGEARRKSQGEGSTDKRSKYTYSPSPPSHYQQIDSRTEPIHAIPKLSSGPSDMKPLETESLDIEPSRKESSGLGKKAETEEDARLRNTRLEPPSVPDLKLAEEPQSIWDSNIPQALERAKTLEDIRARLDSKLEAIDISQIGDVDASLRRSAMDDIWTMIELLPESFVMSGREFAIFDEFDTSKENAYSSFPDQRLAAKAAARYWKNMASMGRPRSPLLEPPASPGSKPRSVYTLNLPDPADKGKPSTHKFKLGEKPWIKYDKELSKWVKVEQEYPAISSAKAKLGDEEDFIFDRDPGRWINPELSISSKSSSDAEGEPMDDLLDPPGTKKGTSAKKAREKRQSVEWRRVKAKKDLEKRSVIIPRESS